jgi:hypothetical protein
MKFILLFFVLTAFIITSNGFLHARKPLIGLNNDTRFLANVKIYSNLAEIIQPLGKLPLEFSAEDWEDIRPDSVTLVGTNVTVTQQTITEKKKTLNNAQVYIRSPSSSNTETKYLKATLIDEQRNLVKLSDKDISKTPVFFTVLSDQILYDEEPPQSKYYVNFTYDTTDAVFVSYLRSNLNWKTSYQLNLFEESKKPVLISMADIRNNGQAKIDIEHAELLGGDINLQASQQPRLQKRPLLTEANMYDGEMRYSQAMSSPPSISQVEEVAGLYVFTIDKPFSIDGKTNYLLPMFRPQVTIERYVTISTYFGNTAGSSTGKARRSYRLSSDRFLSRGNCIIRESDRLAGETSLPDLAAKNKHDFSIGEDADIVYKQNVTLVSSTTFNVTNPSHHRVQSQTRYIYDISLLLKNFKKDRPVKMEYEQRVAGTNIKFTTSNKAFTTDSTTIKYKTTIAANDEQVLSYRIELTT